MYGRTGDLERLNKDRNDFSLSRFVRQRADMAHCEITNQLKDKKLMSLREQLIRAARSHDPEAEQRIQRQMRQHTGEDKETGQ